MGDYLSHSERWTFHWWMCRKLWILISFKWFKAPLDTKTYFIINFPIPPLSRMNRPNSKHLVIVNISVIFTATEDARLINFIWIELSNFICFHFSTNQKMDMNSFYLKSLKSKQYINFGNLLIKHIICFMNRVGWSAWGKKDTLTTSNH